jgi:hypothetical protein
MLGGVAAVQVELGLVRGGWVVQVAINAIVVVITIIVTAVAIA